MSLLPLKMPLRAIAVLCSALVLPGDVGLYAQSAPQPPSGGGETAPLPPPALESLVAPIALYPDPLVAQILAAATYPMEIVEARRWLKKNSGLKGQDLVQAAAKQDWDPSTQALVVFPTVLQQLDENLKWTTALGNAFLAQQEDVLSAVQRLREKAQAAGALQSNAQQKVEVEQVQGSKVIVIQPAQPEVIYVPSYNPVVVFGAAPVYAPYPVMAYPPVSTGATVAASAISFGVGVAMGAYFSGWRGGWGWGCSWGPRPALYVNSTFIRSYGFRGPVGATGNGAWAHNPYYRRAVPYSSAAVAGRYGTGRAVATPYGAAAGVRTPGGAAGAVSGPNGAAAGVRTPRGAAGAISGPNGAAAGIRTPGAAAGAISGPNGAAAGIRTPNGSAGAVTTPKGSAARIQTPQGSVVKTPRGTYTDPKPDAFGGSAARTQMDSQRGAASMNMPRGSGRRR